MATIGRAAFDIEDSSVISRVEWEPESTVNPIQTNGTAGILTVYIRQGEEFPKPYAYLSTREELGSLFTYESAGEWYNQRIKNRLKRYIPYDVALAAISLADGVRELFSENRKVTDELAKKDPKVSELELHLEPERERSIMKTLSKRLQEYNKAERGTK